MKKLITLLIALGSFIPGYSLAATHDIHIEWTYDSQPVEGRTLAGYNLYQEGTKVCSTNSPTDRVMDCTFEAEDGTYLFTLTAFCTDGFESTHSSPYTFTLSSPPEPELIAAFETTPASFSGEVPFTVSFNASISSGNIASYDWDFGDNSNHGSSILVTHTYNTAGTFSATLTLTGTNGTTSQKTVTVSVTPAPIASITTTPLLLTGETPFTVSFDASTSSGDITTYAWDFGDNSSGSGSQTSHTYDTAGTYSGVLTVTSSSGTTSQSSVVINATIPQTSPNTYSLHLEWTYGYESFDGRTLAGYNLYKDGVKICTDTNPADKKTDCSFESEAGTYDFTLTAFFTDGFESPHSSPYTFTLSSASNPELAAAIITTPISLSGDVPFTVLFDGTSSIGGTTYTWTFGDGDTAGSSVAEHTFTAAGTFTTTLMVTNAQGQINATNVTVSVNEVTAGNTPPTAVIASSTAMGDAPLIITFDGSESHDNEGAISSYLWNFGDGTQTTTGTTAAHSYTVAGTYSASLTVTDSQGATNTTSTPVIITGQSAENQTPTARLTTSVIEGTTPFEVVFDASTSTDPEGSVLTYEWNFGDGANGQGATASHVYTIPGIFTATLTVTDNMGATSSASTVINAEGTPMFQMELGEVEIDHNWKRVDFSNTFINPVVVTGSPSFVDSAPCVVRLKNITTTGFDIRIQEWNYLDNTHSKETVSYLVLEHGSFTLADGTMVEAGTFNSDDTNLKTVNFSTEFHTEPVVMTSITTFNEEDAVTVRLCNISSTSFDHKMQEQESLNTHGAETGSYIAWEPSRNNIDNISIIVDRTADKVRNRWYTVDFEEQLTDLPIFIGKMQSLDGIDTSSVRYTNRTNSEVQVMIEEEQSADSETRHTSETVGYFLFSPN